MMVKCLENTKCEATQENLDKLLSITKNIEDNIKNALKYDAYFYVKDDILNWGHKNCIDPTYWDSFYTIHLVNGQFQYVEETSVKEKPKNNFKNYGFEADFEGEILKKVGDYYIGYITRDYCTIIDSTKWDLNGNDVDIQEYHLKPIKKEWYENPDNFPCIVYSTKLNEYIVLDMPLVPLKLNDKFRPATKEEVLSLLIKEE